MSEAFKTLIIGDEQLKRTLGAIGRFSRRPRLAMRDMGAVLEEQAEENFAAEGRPKWQPLSEVTIRARLGGKKAYRKDGGLRKSAERTKQLMKILQDTGQLADSVHSQYGDDYTMIGAGGGEVSKYARIQQLGGKAGCGHKVTIPARPYLPFSADFKLQPEAEKALLKTGMEHLRRAAE